MRLCVQGSLELLRRNGERGYPYAHGRVYAVQDGRMARALKTFRAARRSVRPVLAVRFMEQYRERIRDIIAARNARSS